MELIDLIEQSLVTLSAFGVGYNMRVVSRTFSVLSRDPFKWDLYEGSLKKKSKDSAKDFIDYYVGMPGRFLTYKVMGKFGGK